MTGYVSFFHCTALSNINSVRIPDLLSCLVCKLPISGLQKKNRGLTLEKTPDFAKVIVSGDSRRAKVIVSGASRRYHFPNSRPLDCQLKVLRRKSPRGATAHVLPNRNSAPFPRRSSAKYYLQLTSLLSNYGWRL